MALLLPPPPLHDHLLNTPKILFYLTTVHELRADMDQYMYSIDRCHTSIDQANERLSLLSRCNTNPARREALSVGVDPLTGGRWCAWSRNPEMESKNPDSGKKDRATAEGAKFRFLAEVKPILMHGDLLTTGPSDDAHGISPADAAATTMTEIRYLFERRKDLAFHVWAVAIHHAGRHRQIRICEETGQPMNLPWSLESVHPVSGNALARAKRLWTEQLLAEKGRFDRLDLHYGFARYVLLPLSTTVNFLGKTAREITKYKIEMESQIRVERIKVTPEWEMAAPFAPAEAILPTRPFQALCPGREESVGLEGRENVGFSVLEQEFEDIFKDFTEEKEVEDGSEEASKLCENGEEQELMAKKTPPTPTPVFLPFLGQPHIGTQRAPLRPNVVREYGTLALQMREKQEEKMEEIVNKAHSSSRWSKPRSRPLSIHTSGLKSFFGGPSSSPSAAEFAAVPKVIAKAKSSEAKAGTPDRKIISAENKARTAENKARSVESRIRAFEERTRSARADETGSPRERKGKGRVRFAMDEHSEVEERVLNSVSGGSVKRRVSVRRYAHDQESGSKRVSWMGALM